MYSKNKKSYKKLVWVAAIAAVIIASVTLTALEATNTTHLFHSAPVKVAPTASQDTKGEAPASSQSTPSPQNSNTPATSQPGDSKSDAGSTTSGQVLLAPSGNFVSAHKVPLTAQLASVCNTTPGATCQIIFTSSSVTKSLVMQTTDRGGSTYWNSWTPKDIGLSAGSWQITAKASLGGKSSSTADALQLVVSQ